jgi:hypothetical protein
MIFLIEYDRSTGVIVSQKGFPDAEQRTAEASRLELELALNRSGIVHEVVLLQAETEQALRRTHRRYFENLTELSKTEVSRPQLGGSG